MTLQTSRWGIGVETQITLFSLTRLPTLKHLTLNEGISEWLHPILIRWVVFWGAGVAPRGLFALPFCPAGFFPAGICPAGISPYHPAPLCFGPRGSAVRTTRISKLWPHPEAHRHRQSGGGRIRITPHRQYRERRARRCQDSWIWCTAGRRPGWPGLPSSCAKGLLWRDFRESWGIFARLALPAAEDPENKIRDLQILLRIPQRTRARPLIWTTGPSALQGGSPRFAPFPPREAVATRSAAARWRGGLAQFRLICDWSLQLSPFR